MHFHQTGGVLCLQCFYFCLYPWHTKYRGYIVFVFSITIFVCLCVSVCKLFFFVKDFSGTTAPWILKFGTNIGYAFLYSVRENLREVCVYKIASIKLVQRTSDTYGNRYI